MGKTVCIQVHDYDRYGFYHIVDDRNATIEELAELKEKARKSVHLDWNELPKEADHVVYYAEVLGNDGEPWFAAIYMHGEAYCEKEFDRIFHGKSIGYVGAFHKRV